VYGFASTTKTVGDEGEVQAGEFVHAKPGASVPSMRCYLKYKDGQQFTGAGARLSGKPSKRGIYINNGRKIVIK
jgi:hypothetical protein